MFAITRLVQLGYTLWLCYIYFWEVDWGGSPALLGITEPKALGWGWDCPQIEEIFQVPYCPACEKYVSDIVAKPSLSLEKSWGNPRKVWPEGDSGKRELTTVRSLLEGMGSVPWNSTGTGFSPNTSSPEGIQFFPPGYQSGRKTPHLKGPGSVHRLHNTELEGDSWKQVGRLPITLANKLAVHLHWRFWKREGQVSGEPFGKQATDSI